MKIGKCTVRGRNLLPSSFLSYKIAGSVATCAYATTNTMGE
jgi:hypothetical protein